MTEHPLTDEICDQILDSIPKLRRDEQGHILSYDGQRILDGMFEELSEVSNAEMRAAADWQLERAIAWLKFNTDDYLLQDYYKTYFLTKAFLNDFKKAMRPTQEEMN